MELIKDLRMEITHSQMLPAFYLFIPFFLLLIFVNYLGYRFKNMHIRKFPGTEHVGIGPTEGSLLGLTALLLSFTFGMTATKYELRRQHIVTETNEIGTTILRCDLFPDSARKLLKVDLRNYLENRIDYYAVGDNEEKIAKNLIQGDSISVLIWNRTAQLSHDPANLIASQQMIPSVNAMIDIVVTREAARNAMVPGMILVVLCVLILVSAFLSGYGSRNLERNRVLVIAFAFITSLALYLVLDLDNPRQGFVNLNSTEKLLIDLRGLFDDKP
jgi:hypothetical protein